MPLYEFKCPDCDAVEEVLLKHDSEDIIECPYCELETGPHIMDKLISRVSFAFVGGSPTGSKGHGG